MQEIKTIIYKEKDAWFNGVKYRKLRNGYYHASIDNTTCYLHRDVWTYYHGEIPIGNQVHHLISRDYNEVDGLVCLSESEHKAHHIVERMNNMEKIDYVCTNCGHVFNKKYHFVEGSNRFCSDRCRRHFIYYNEQIVVTCKHCGKEILTHKYREKGFCSRECLLESCVTKCLECGEEFVPSKPGQKYCSKECGQKYRYSKQTENERKKVCPHCGKPFLAFKTDQIYCCNICAQVERTKRYRARKKMLNS